MKEDMKYRIPFDNNTLNKRQVARFISLAKTPAEKKVWRDMLNGPEFHKPKDRAGRKIVKDAKAEEQKAA